MQANIFDLKDNNSISFSEREDIDNNPGFQQYRVSWQLVLLNNPIKQASIISYHLIVTNNLSRQIVFEAALLFAASAYEISHLQV